MDFRPGNGETMTAMEGTWTRGDPERRLTVRTGACTASAPESSCIAGSVAPKAGPVGGDPSQLSQGEASSAEGSWAE